MPFTPRLLQGRSILGTSQVRRRILYVQFTDPGAYPPIQHSSLILADRGWKVALLGTGSFANQDFVFRPHPHIRIKRLRFVRGGWKQKLQYLVYFIWSLCWTLVWRPQWIYASDPMSAPIAWFISKITNVRVIYHEHDSPDLGARQSHFMHTVLRFRERLGRDAELCVLPQRDRMIDFVRHTRRSRPTLCVWNCPGLQEVVTNNLDHNQVFTLHYHGSINSSRLPPQLIVAVSRFKGSVRLQVAGYETIGNVGYLESLNRLAVREGVPGIIDFLGVITFRPALLCSLAKADVGISFTPRGCDDFNMRHMVGASNKPFDCMAGGLPLLVSNQRDWISTFVEPGYARACDPNDPDSIEAELRWYLDHPKERSEMGLRCKRKVERDWHYEVMFDRVSATIESD
jgi:glycosyltransferase involved in cell wall biosynthesis